MSSSFTVSAGGRLRELAFTCHISEGFDPADPANHKRFFGFRAIFDTGATNSVITQKVVDACGLKQISLRRVYHADGESNAEVYLVNIMLPNRVGFPLVNVTKQKLPPSCDMLIGMDIIGGGDFAVTTKDGKTVFTFRCPSVECIDFVKSGKPKPVILTGPNFGRNSPCSCGSGKKFKKCCGAA